MKNPIKKMLEFYNDWRIDGIKNAFEAQLQLEQKRNEKMIESLNKSFDERIRMKDIQFDDTLRRIRAQEKTSYLKTVNILEAEVVRLKKVVDDNNGLYFALTNKERELHRTAEEMGDDLAIAIKKCEEAVNYTRIALGKAEKFSVNYLGVRRRFLKLEQAS